MHFFYSLLHSRFLVETVFFSILFVACLALGFFAREFAVDLQTMLVLTQDWGML